MSARSVADDAGKLILRLALGVLLLFHGVARITGGVGFIERMLQGAGLPGFIAYGVYVGEVLAPLLVIAGWYSRIGAILIMVDGVFVFILAHPGEFFARTRGGGWALELEAFYFLTALALVFLGPGRIAINGR